MFFIILPNTSLPLGKSQGPLFHRTRQSLRLPLLSKDGDESNATTINPRFFRFVRNYRAP